ncbi:MAG TPA: hypothetical protein VE988_02800 [Gemmataceae bacterium]|nr:hypothetical protein [Gemmataceae bacterium]
MEAKPLATGGGSMPDRDGAAAAKKQQDRQMTLVTGGSPVS